MGFTLLEMFRMFPLPLLAAVTAGLVLPLLGCFLHVRRTSFYGVVLPQFGAVGVAFAYVILPWWIATIGLGSLDVLEAIDSPARITPYLLGWSVVFSILGLGFLAVPGASGGELGRVAALLGIWISFEWDWPFGPSIVAAAAPALPLGWLAGRLRG